MTSPRGAALRLSLGVSLGLAACFHDGGLRQDGSGTGATSTGGSSGGPSTTTSGATTGEATGDASGTAATTGEPGPPAGLDILFVVDNSSSMADEQALLAKAAGALFAATVGRDVRVGVTTTDMGNPRCVSLMTTPEMGGLVRSSCVDRVEQGEFTYLMSTYAFACTDRCALKDAELQVTPTATALDPEPKPRAWIESIGGVTNLPEGITLAQAFQCFAPQGVVGCGLESPLAAARAAVWASKDPGSPNFGFVRDDADLMIVILSDEMDCSAAPAGAEIFTTNKVFWNDPNDVTPTSAVCLRAGSQCVGAGPVYDSCAAVDKDDQGALTDDPGAAVLVPVSEFVAFFAGVAAAKVGGARVFARVIGGVPPGYEEGAPLVFQDSEDAMVQKEFGIGFGCEADLTLRGLPPLRTLEVAAGLPGSRVYSICAADYGPALTDFAFP